MGLIKVQSFTDSMPMPKPKFRILPRIAFVIGLAAMARLASGAAAQENTPIPAKVQFNRDVRPIFSDTCFKCHGPDAKARKAKLRLDVREDALAEHDGKLPIVPGKSAKSEAYRRLVTTDRDDLMPPPSSNKKLTKRQIELIRRWIDQGAEYQPHWSYIPPTRPELPKVKNKSWVRSPIDHFILSKLEVRKIKPSPEADRRMLLRRLSLDLIGLPHTPQEVEAFMNDRSHNAYERQVDRLLASPHFGERMAVPWLDVVRFADTVGYHGDQNQNVFPYRDYVIDAFNHNKPFDQFTIEQLAGDLLPNATTEQEVATCFNRLNMMTREGGAQPKEYLAKYQADRVRTVSTTWLGSTMACCECHDHKFDPFSTKDFYQMEAFFADVKQWGYYADAPYAPTPDLKGFGNDHPFPPLIEAENPYLQRRLAKLEKQITELVSASAARMKSSTQQQAAFDEWRLASENFLKQWPDGWASPPPQVTLKMKDTNAVPGTNFTVQADMTISFSDQAKENLRVTLPLSNSWIAAVRVQLLSQEAAADAATQKKKAKGGSLALTATLKSGDGTNETKLVFFHAEADRKEERYFNGASIIGVKDLWQLSTDPELQTAVWLLDKPVRVKNGDSLVVNLGNVAISSARISVTPFAAEDPLKAGSGEPLAKALSSYDNSKAISALLNETYLLSTGCWDADEFAQYKTIERNVLECRHGRAFTQVTVAWEPRTTRVLPRGNWQNESGEIVQPLPPHFLPQPANPEGRRLNRLDLAKWLVSPGNPLTARTIMNRLWKQFFGAGLCTTVDDLGMQGDTPSHPELLDWLAVEFMQPSVPQTSSLNSQPVQAWDVKHMVKLMVMSATYSQDSNERPELKEIDPGNRLLASQNPRRLEAEFVRDNALFIAGLLNEDIGGPSAHPYQPAGYYANLQFPDRDYYPDKDERQYRRGLYTHWQRTFLQPMLANFDAPAREECTAFRIVSNTPQQALTLLNDPTFTEASHVFAQRILAVGNSPDDERLDLIYKRALGRPIKAKEKASLKNFLAVQRDYYRSNSQDADKLIHVGLAKTTAQMDATELAAWTQVCRVVLNLHETITCY
ncbi:MAG: PSD1 domain-containing protein [Verrucomicrobia bacterium]|nr:PSD1 domain-containing protein [Verrucomicrobiota bacterium]